MVAEKLSVENSLNTMGVGVGLCNYLGQQNNHLWERRRQFGSIKLRNHVDSNVRRLSPSSLLCVHLSTANLVRSFLMIINLIL